MSIVLIKVLITKWVRFRVSEMRTKSVRGWLRLARRVSRELRFIGKMRRWILGCIRRALFP